MIRKILLIVETLILLVVVAVLGTASIICCGPSPAARDIFVNTVMETSAAKFAAYIFFTDSEIKEIRAENSVKVPDTVTDISSVSINTAVKNDVSADAIEIKDVSGSTFSGKMMIVHDPSRVSIYTIDSFNTEGHGKLLEDMIDETGSVAGINAGGFYDPDGKGHGGMPLGPVIKNGALVSSYESDYRTLIGFSADHKLMVGAMSAQDAISAGMVDGICFGPELVVNGERIPISGSGGGLNPRTAIGQTADGSILLLVIDGRQPGSLGASIKDLADVMISYGAVNAANLDGGSSSVMYYNGEMLNHSASLVGIRPIPDAILVK